MKYIKDAVEDLLVEQMMWAYNHADKIYKEASEGLLDDDHEQVDMNAEDIMRDRVKELLK